ncbi:hypothetical protein [Streptacidiphilus sp. PAMC 29251]
MDLAEQVYQERYRPTGRMTAALMGGRVAFRVDADGVTLGGLPPRYRSSTAFIPWPDVMCLRLWEHPAGRARIPCIAVVRHPGGAELPRGFGYGRFNRRVTGQEARASRTIRMWSLDVERLRTVMAEVAPGRTLAGDLTVQPPSAVRSRRFLLRSLRRQLLDHVLWKACAPLMIFGSLVTVGSDLVEGGGPGRGADATVGAIAGVLAVAWLWSVPVAVLRRRRRRPGHGPGRDW